MAVPQQNSGLAAIELDSSVTLEETSGSNGYALRITNGRNPGFEWHRTGSTSASVYSGGQAYEDGIEIFSGERDFVLGLESTDRAPTNQPTPTANKNSCQVLPFACLLPILLILE